MENKEQDDKFAFNMLLQYEILSSKITPLIWFGWGQSLTAKYFVWKTERKFKRYKKNIKVQQELTK